MGIVGREGRSNLRRARVEKLEQILRAEDAAHRATDEARAEAAAVVADARTRAAEIRQAGRDATRAKVAERREELLSAARHAADGVDMSAGTDAAAVLAEADARSDRAIAAVLAALKDQ